MFAHTPSAAIVEEKKQSVTRQVIEADVRFEPHQLTLSDISCPITGQIFFDPVKVQDCKHIFESEALADWRKINNTCPCCRQSITGLEPAPAVFTERFHATLEKNPELHEERYFNLQTLHDLLHEDDADEDRLNKMVELLRYATSHLNAILPDNNPDGMTAVYALAGSRKGVAYLAMDSLLRDNINSAGLNTPAQGGRFAGYSAVTWLMAERGKKVLFMDPVLRSKITPQGLNTAGRVGEHPAMSGAGWGLLTETGHKLLATDPELCTKINAERLNTPLGRIPNGENAPSTGVTYLLRDEFGVKLLLKSVALRSKISAVGLNAKVYMKPAGSTTAMELADSEAGIKLLALSPGLRKKMSSQNLNGIVESGEWKGCSAVRSLVRGDNGISLLLSCPRFRKKINADGLKSLAVIDNTSAVYFLARSPLGRKLLLKDERLRKLITAESLSTAVTLDGSENGKTAAEWLLSTPDGRELLKIDTELRLKVISVASPAQLSASGLALPAPASIASLGSSVNDEELNEQKITRDSQGDALGLMGALSFLGGIGPQSVARLGVAFGLHARNSKRRRAASGEAPDVVAESHAGSKRPN
jgi:hypothetical protein